MRKVVLITLVAGLLMGIVSLAWATEMDVGEEVQVWKWDKDPYTGQWTWIPETKGSRLANTRAWKQGEALSGFCNKETWTIDVATHASIAQWIKWQLNAQGWRFYVRKPGTYIADCISGSIKSNADVLVTFSGFDDLKNTSGEAIETYYSFGEEMPSSAMVWYPAKTLGQETLRVPYCEHNAHLWIKIVVREDASGGYPKTRACEYQNDATVKISVTVYKPWLDNNGLGIFAE
ncbi:MAG: hypothetical protein ACP5PC_06170 [bacterium]